MRTLTKHPFVLIFCFIFFTFSPRISIANDTITSIQSLKDDGQTLVSAGQVFELGFFSPGNSKKNRYIGIWYKNISTTVVWVANRGKPISNSDGVLTIGDDGNLVLSNRAASVFWSSNRSSNPMDISNTFAQLLDNGNLVVIDGNDHNSESFLWQSFDYPSDTLLPGMKLGWDLRTGLNRFLTSWASADDPSPGAYSFKIDPNGSPQVFLWKGADRIYRSGPWNGFQFSGVPEMKPNFIFDFEFVTNQDEVYYRFELYPNVSAISRLLVNNTGLLQRFTWQDQARGWNFFWSAPKDQCDDYKECGPYGFCNNNLSPICQCVKGFQPKSPQEWYFRDGSNGCVRKTPLDCRKGDGFYKLTGMKLPDTSHSLVDQSKSLKECEDECLKNCSCMAYASANVTGGSGCVIWDGDLIDLRQYTTDGGQDLYVRLASSELDEGGNVESSRSSRDNKKQVIVIVASVVIPSMIILLLLSGLCVWKRKTMKGMLTRKAKTKPKERGGAMDYSGECREEELELPLFDFYTIKAATNNFSDENKIGEGGFGCVYKGSLTEGQEIAVKRLSKTSGQGLDEFKNEVILIAKLQHRNLVRLLGCCIEGEEKMLIYEYMKNGSLDSFIFDKTRSAILDWPKRFQIISGIARGLLYLHQDSRFRIIHRDLKAGNILLDNEMYPKISDFGMARIFGADQTEANTRRIVGTYGYMSPEYAIDGLFSVKSDVFSFGVLVLEIISALKNRGFKNYDHNLNLLGHAWKLWKERKGSEMIDQSMDSVSYSLSEVLRCIHVGLLCVQELAEDRPTMSSVVLMLGSASAVLPQPKAPGFCTGRSVYGTDSSSAKMETSCTVNDMTITMLEAR